MVVGDMTLDVRVNWAIAAGRGRLRQLLENLFRNAVEHGSTGSRDTPDNAVEHGFTGNLTASGDVVEHGSDGDSLTVVVTGVDDGFTVKDDGSGISEAERTNVFERGYTTHENRTGFGLPIIKAITDAHGWSVSLGESDTAGVQFEFAGVGTDPEPANAEQSTSD